MNQIRIQEIQTPAAPRVQSNPEPQRIQSNPEPQRTQSNPEPQTNPVLEIQNQEVPTFAHRSLEAELEAIAMSNTESPTTTVTPTTRGEQANRAIHPVTPEEALLQPDDSVPTTRPPQPQSRPDAISIQMPPSNNG